MECGARLCPSLMMHVETAIRTFRHIQIGYVSADQHVISGSRTCCALWAMTTQGAAQIQMAAAVLTVGRTVGASTIWLHARGIGAPAKMGTVAPLVIMAKKCALISTAAWVPTVESAVSVSTFQHLALGTGAIVQRDFGG